MQVLTRRAILVLVAWIAALSTGRAQKGVLGSKSRIALDGYDPVSYFEPGRPEKGTPDFAFAFDDATYWFKSQEHRAKFVADPERYAPQYTGYCALTLAAGAKAEADPEAWSIFDGKLYVFGSKAGVPKFNLNPAGVVTNANSNWQQLHGSK